jgi:hypothetical protein
MTKREYEIIEHMETILRIRVKLIAIDVIKSRLRIKLIPFMKAGVR